MSIGLSIGIGAALASGSALAQANPAPPTPAAAPPGGVETVVVTGSRIPRPEVDSPNPVMSVGSQEILHSGITNLADYLTRLPALTGSMTSLSTSGLNTPQTAAGSSLGGLNLLDLRNLGFDRTLVLEDGQRVVSSSAGDAAVDTNTIPITLIQRVDVETGGASAVYGADAVTGVVNFIMKHDLEGIDARVQANVSQDGGGNEYIEAVSIGHNFDNGNGNIEATFENTYQQALGFADRDFTNVGGAKFFFPNPANPTALVGKVPSLLVVNNGTIIIVANQGAIDTNLDIVPDFLGSGAKFISGQLISGDIEHAIGGSGLPAAPAFLANFIPIQHREIAEVSGDEEFSHWFKLSGEFRFVHIDSKSFSEPSFNALATIRSDNPFLPANVVAAMNDPATAAVPGFAFFGSYPYQGTQSLVFSERLSRQVYRGVLSATGDFPLPSFMHDGKYELHYVYGQTNVDDTTEHNLAEDRYYAALDVVTDPATGNPVCRSSIDGGQTPLSLLGTSFDGIVGLDTRMFGTTFTPGANSGCVPYNPFSLTDPRNKAAVKWMTMNTTTTSFIAQQDFNGFVSFNLPQVQDWGLAGPLSFVLGGEWREEVSKSVSDPITRQLQIPGAGPGETQSDFFSSGGPPVSGRFHVTEAFGELNVPVLADKFLAKELSFDFAGRVSDYSTAGTDETWKIDAVWAPVEGIRFRGTHAYAVRAPNIGELFAPLVQGFQGINDPCDAAFVRQGVQPNRFQNCQALENILLGPGVYVAGVTRVQQPVTLPVFIGGNQGLSPETARTETLGVVLQPDFLPGLSATVDWYRVTIADAIASLSGQTIANQCVDLSTIQNAFCAAVTRNGNSAALPGSIKQIIAQEINVAQEFTQGEDFTISYHADLDDWFDSHVGTLDVHLIGNHLDKLSFTSLAGQTPVNGTNVINGGADGGPAPSWQFNIDALWTHDDWTVDYDVQWADGVLNTDRQTMHVLPNVLPPGFLHAPARNIHSIQVGYDIAEGWNLYVGVNNLWYQKPSANDYGNGWPADPLGRVFYGGVKIDLDPW